MIRAKTALVGIRSDAVKVVLGVVLLAALAQVSIPLPWTPVPVTGQTLGIALLGLIWGRALSLYTVLVYLGLGFSGVPIFAGGTSGLWMGPTMGYLIGMIASSQVIGYFADKGVTGHFPRALGVCYLGSFFVFFFGLTWLSLFIPSETLLTAGLYPFLLGDAIKNTLAAWIGSSKLNT